MKVKVSPFIHGPADEWLKEWFPLDFRGRFVKSVSVGVLSFDWAHKPVCGCSSEVNCWKNLYQFRAHSTTVPFCSEGLSCCMHCHHSSALALQSGRAFFPFLVHPSYFSGTQRWALVCSPWPAIVAAVLKNRIETNKQTKTQTRKIKYPKLLQYKSVKMLLANMENSWSWKAKK